ncbi:amino acid ABC transporter substrate-binding protein (PAAT family) [Paraburkholderia caballeronis]|uniref:transporter substrate-binding domain-containing protein n=1 Tax=Paraburkholderia caballeronis TaxID=416943 RepID=UPI001066D2C8|nr:transporter substrate-binding domain-containing protein [Paraburkholderia caballeronis]TDV33856.1 amino acid ABC transporter substrate-binding protein (PAAT family) [Paraburkholderia caballeronis]
MKLARIKNGFLALFAGMLLVSHVVRADTLSDIKTRGSINVGIDFTHPPYGMMDQNAAQTGTDYEIAQLIAKDLGVKLTVVSVNGPNRIPFLLTKKVDIVVASFSVTDERKKVISFTRPYATEPIYVVAQGTQRYRDLTALSGQTVATARGTTADLDLVAALKEKNVQNVNIVRYLDEATERTAVLSGQQTTFVAAAADALAVKQTAPSSNFQYQFKVSEDPLAIGLRKDDPTLQAWLDSWIGANLQNGRLDSIWKKYFGTDISQVVY